MNTELIAQTIINYISTLVSRENWSGIIDFANSNFFTALIGSLAGAFAGAVAAQRVAERSKLREELLQEMRNTNAATAISFSIFNNLLSIKKQHVKDLKVKYDDQCNSLEEFKRQRVAGEIPMDEVFEFQANFFSIQTQTLPIDTLKAIVFERLSIVGRPLNLVVSLTQAIEDLKGSLMRRNSLIDDYKTKFATDKQLLVNLYFGTPLGEGEVNLEYPSTVDAIYNQTDDGIYFSMLLCSDLHKHGISLSDIFKKKFRDSPPPISEVDLTTIPVDLMPKTENYLDWDSSFKKKPPNKA